MCICVYIYRIYIYILYTLVYIICVCIYIVYILHRIYIDTYLNICITYLDIMYKSIYYVYRHTHKIIYRYIYTYIYIYIISGNRLYDPFFRRRKGGVFSIITRLPPVVTAPASRETLIDEQLAHRVSRVYIYILHA